MEWLKNRTLKQSFFIISALFLCVGLLLSVASFWFCVKLQRTMAKYPRYEISIGENSEIISSEYTQTEQEANRMNNIKIMLIRVLQFVLLISFVVLSLILADITFWRLKLKKPLAVLQNGAERIQQKDLDFELVKCSDDELGLLCSAFEQMRIELLNNNRELWQQIEERKRLNAAFSHDLRNPITVLKGSAALLQKSFKSKNVDAENAEANLSLIISYTNRIENYIEAMTMAQKLEDWKCSPMPVDWSLFTEELERSLSFLSEGTKKKITFSICGAEEQIHADKAIVQNVAENLTNNALRYANTIVNIAISHSAGKMTICVMDNGNGFSPVVLDKGIRPFLRGSEEQEHFGMGLYVCRLLCIKHGGNLDIENTGCGAKVTASFEDLKP